MAVQERRVGGDLSPHFRLIHRLREEPNRAAKTAHASSRRLTRRHQEMETVDSVEVL